MSKNIVNEFEYLDIVDENDNVVGKDTKDNKFAKELISRNIACFVSNDKGQILIVKRSPNKKSFPNRYDLAACGNVKSGETYEEAAKREIKEELGVDCPIKALKKLFNRFEENGKKLRYFTTIFQGKWNGGVKLNEELTELKKMSIAEVEKKIKENGDLFTPGFINDFNEVKNTL